MKIRSLFDNFEIKLICLFLAVVMWLYANKPEGTKAVDKIMSTVSGGKLGMITFMGVPVELKGVTGDWEAVPKSIMLDVESFSAKITPSGFRVTVNLTHIDELERKVTLNQGNVVLPEGMKFIKAKPSQIRIRHVYEEGTMP